MQEYLPRIIGVVIDVLFLTCVYNKKHQIKDYYLVVIALSIVGFFIRKVFDDMFVSIFITTALSLIISLYIRDKKALACFEISILGMFLLDIATLEMFESHFYIGSIANVLIKILLITFSGEFAKLTIIGKMENFTVKALIIIFIFINIAFGAYLMSKGV